jgi:hypothetical protein
MSAWQAYKVMLLGLAVPMAAVVVEVTHALFAPKQSVGATEEATLVSVVVPSSTTTADPNRFSLTREAAKTWQPPANAEPELAVPTATPSALPPHPPLDDPGARGVTANAPNDRVQEEAQRVEATPADGGDSP